MFYTSQTQEFWGKKIKFLGKDSGPIKLASTKGKKNPQNPEQTYSLYNPKQVLSASWGFQLPGARGLQTLTEML